VAGAAVALWDEREERLHYRIHNDGNSVDRADLAERDRLVSPGNTFTRLGIAPTMNVMVDADDPFLLGEANYLGVVGCFSSDTFGNVDVALIVPVADVVWESTLASANSVTATHSELLTGMAVKKILVPPISEVSTTTFHRNAISTPIEGVSVSSFFHLVSFLFLTVRLVERRLP